MTKGVAGMTEGVAGMAKGVAGMTGGGVGSRFRGSKRTRHIEIIGGFGGIRLAREQEKRWECRCGLWRWGAWG